MKKYNQLIAINLAYKMQGIKRRPPPISGFTIYRLEYLISLILTHKQKKHEGAWSLLNMQYMTNIVPQANKYLNFLKEQGIIEWINYSAGRNSRLYRLVEEGHTKLQAITDKTLIRRIEEHGHKLHLHNSKMYPDLNKWIKCVDFDYKEAIKTVETTYAKNVKLDAKKAEARRNYSLSAILRIESGEIYYKVNSTNFRLDSNYTSLPSELMQHLTIKGRAPYEMDISNSQPFFLATLFDMTPEIEKVFKKYLGNSLTMSTKALQLSKYDDVKLYRLLVITGKIYEYMMKKFDEHGIKYRNRREFKDQFFLVFFGKTDIINSPAAKLFKHEFPNVQRLIDLIKAKHHNQLPILLQRIESYTILDRVVKAITTELPKLPILTKHDSILPFKIMVYGTELDKAREIMVRIITEATGLTPQGRMKRLQTRIIDSD